MRRVFLALVLLVAVIAPAAAQRMSVLGAGGVLAAAPSNSIAVSCPGTGSTSSTIACSGTYTGTAPSTSGWTYSWNSTCSGSGTPTVSGISGGTITTITVTTPGSACTGTVTLTDNLSDSANSGSVVISAPGYTGPGDLTTYKFWYGLRAYSAAVAAAGTQPMINVVRASDSHSCDILPATNGDLGLTANCSTGGDNGQSAASFKGASTFAPATWYDQTGNGLNATAGATKTELLLSNASCPSAGKPCIGFYGGDRAFHLSSVGTMTSPQSLSAVVWNYQPGGFGTSEVLRWNDGASLSLQFSGSNQIQLYAGSLVNATASDNAWHASEAVANGASSVIMVDGTDTTGTAGTNAPAGTNGFLGCDPNGGAPTNCFAGYITEAGGAVGTAWSSGTRTSIDSNAHTYWGF